MEEGKEMEQMDKMDEMLRENIHFTEVYGIDNVY